MKRLLLAIVVVQLVCHHPRTGLNIYEMVMLGEQPTQNNNDDTDAGTMQAFKGSPISLDQPWLIDLSHLLLVISASCNVLIFTAQVLLKTS